MTFEVGLNQCIHDGENDERWCAEGALLGFLKILNMLILAVLKGPHVAIILSRNHTFIRVGLWKWRTAEPMWVGRLFLVCYITLAR